MDGVSEISVQLNEFHVLMPELENGDSASITVYDMNGITVLTEKLSTSGQINHYLASGMYIMNIASKDFNVTKKLVVK